MLQWNAEGIYIHEYIEINSRYTRSIPLSNFNQ